jgi:LmbE family N-acetylglucosaminyl deacetylase
MREEELRAASRVLAVTNLVLLDYQDGMLPWADAGRLEADIAAAIRRFRPDVVLTFGEDGLYWHPDHIAIHERTTAVVVSLGSEAPALYYVTMPPGSMRAIVAQAEERRARGAIASPLPTTILGVREPDAFGAHAATPTLIVTLGGYARRKLAALRCHRTQLGDSALASLADDDAEQFLGVEHYRRAAGGPQADAFIEQLGLRRESPQAR